MTPPYADKTLVIITGPTAGGKTALALDLAENLGCEIISADSRQMFRGMEICTAAPTPAEQARVKHHLVGNLSVGDYYSAALFEQDALRLLQQQWQRSDVAVVCGGSMMYIDALTDGIDLLPTISAGVRAEALHIYNTEGLEGVTSRLDKLDPLFLAQCPDLKNHRRLVHALEICMQGGVPYSSLRTGKKVSRPFRILKYALERPREELFTRINRRVELMIEQGLVDEVRSLLDFRNQNALNSVGIREIIHFLDGEWTLPVAIARIQKNTRVYAKKQLTWLNKRADAIRLSPADPLTTILRHLHKN